MFDERMYPFSYKTAHVCSETIKKYSPAIRELSPTAVSTGRSEGNQRTSV